jgi:hypothetical protein
VVLFLPRRHGDRVMCPSIQVIERDGGPGARRWMVGVFFADLHVDLRFKRRSFATKEEALKLAFIYAMRRIPGAIIEPWCGHWLARNDSDSISVMVVECP